jgi:hypothetical protein
MYTCYTQAHDTECVQPDGRAIQPVHICTLSEPDICADYHAEPHVESHADAQHGGTLAFDCVAVTRRCDDLSYTRAVGNAVALAYAGPDGSECVQLAAAIADAHARAVGIAFARTEPRCRTRPVITSILKHRTHTLAIFISVSGPVAVNQLCNRTDSVAFRVAEQPTTDVLSNQRPTNSGSTYQYHAIARAIASAHRCSRGR